MNTLSNSGVSRTKQLLSMLTVFLLALGGFFAVPASSHASEAVVAGEPASAQENVAGPDPEVSGVPEIADESEAVDGTEESFEEPEAENLAVEGPDQSSAEKNSGVESRNSDDVDDDGLGTNQNASVEAELETAEQDASASETVAEPEEVVSFATEVVLPQPVLEVSKSSGLVEGEEITVTGSGYNPDQGVYLTTCTDIELADVSFQFINDCGRMSGAVWVFEHGSARTPQLNADGSFEVTFAPVKREGSTALYTIADRHAMEDRSQDAKVSLSFESEEPSTPAAITLENPNAVQGGSIQFVGTGFESGSKVRGTVYSDPFDLGSETADQNGMVVFNWNIPADFPAGNHTVELVSGGTVASLEFVIEKSIVEDQKVATGSLLWSFKNSWNTYLNMFSGTIDTSDGATLGSDSTLGFVQVPGGGYDPDTELGAIHYQGTAVYSIEQHGFEITLKDPWVIFGKNSTELSAVVSVEAEPDKTDVARVTLATLQAGKGSEKDGLFTWTNVAGTFSEIPHPEEWIEYSGQAIDPVTFSFGSEAQEIPVDGSTPPKKIVAEIGSGDEQNNLTGAGSAVATKTAQPEQCTARAVTGGSMTWGFLTNYRNYVEGRIAKGNFSGGSFSAVSGALNPKSNGVGIANFAGSIVATGHNGLMNFQLSNPSIQITGPNTATLFASTSTTDMSGNPSVSGRVAYANLSFGSLNISGNSVSVSGASATLTAAGSSMFGAEFSGQYPAGTALDPVSFSVTLGAEVPCDGSTDPEVLASTGSESPTQALGLAVMALLLGASLVLIGRKKHVTQLS